MRQSSQDETFNELTLLRQDPTIGMDSSAITLSLEPPSRRISPAGEGLITLIYPKEPSSPQCPLAPLSLEAATPPFQPHSHNQNPKKPVLKQLYKKHGCLGNRMLSTTANSE